MRGKGTFSFYFPPIFRITPAYAGKRFFACMRGNRQRDHPRLCGEKLFIYIVAWFDVGSPPPMRGKVVYSIASVE